MKWLKRDGKGELKPGSVFEKYTVEKLLGCGGMGSVYLVRHNVLDSRFALKILPRKVAAARKQFVDRFIREAKLACRIRHPNLIAVHDAGYSAASGIYYIVMDYVPGGTLRDLLRREGRLAPRRALEIVEQIADALDAAHRYRMVHRDIKPDNIMFAADGSAKLADLGIAKSTDDQDTALTVADSVFGTPAYMSPEQAKDSGDVDCRADIYSLGIVFYEMLTGQRPFRGESSIQILSQVVAAEEIPDIRSVCPALPSELAAAVAAMTAKKREDRIPTPALLLEKLRALRLPEYAPASPAAPPDPDAATVEATKPMAALRAAVPPPPPSEKKIVAGSAPPKRSARRRGTAKRLLPAAVGGGLFLIIAAAVAILILLRHPGNSAAPRKAAASAPAPAVSAAPAVPVSFVAPPAPAPAGFASDPLGRGRIVLLGAASDELRSIRDELRRKFGEARISFQESERIAGYQRQLERIIRSSPAAVLLCLSGKYAEDRISKSGFENIVCRYTDLLRDSGIPFGFLLSAENGDEHLRFCNATTVELCKLRSVPVSGGGPPQSEASALAARLGCR